MAHLISCGNPACGQRLQVGPEHLGKVVRCPGCQQLLTVPPLAPVPPSPPPQTAIVPPAPVPRGTRAPIPRSVEARPRRTPASSAFSPLVWTVGVLALLGVVACGAALLLYSHNKELNSRLRLAEEQTADAQQQVEALRQQLALAEKNLKQKAVASTQPLDKQPAERQPTERQPPKLAPEEKQPPPQTSVSPVSDPYRAIDAHALAASPEVEGSIATLAAYLVKPAQNDREKVRAIFRWVADRIVYDVEGFLKKKPGDNRAEAVLKSRLAVCEGYANLFESLCLKANIEVVKVSGYAKGYGYVLGQRNTGSNHAWNAVKLEGRWQALDTTWAAGTIKDDKFSKRFDDFFFLPPPEEFIFTHFPRDPRWQLLTTPVAQSEYDKWQTVDQKLFRLGWKPAQVRKMVADPSVPMVKIFEFPAVPLVFQEAPLEGKLKTTNTYRFRIEARGVEAMAILCGTTGWHHMTRKGDVFEGEITPPRGQMRIVGRAPGDEQNRFWGVLEYTIE